MLRCNSLRDGEPMRVDIYSGWERQSAQTIVLSSDDTNERAGFRRNVPSGASVAKVLFIHQNFPGQFRHIAVDLAQSPSWEVLPIGRDTAAGVCLGFN